MEISKKYENTKKQIVENYFAYTNKMYWKTSKTFKKEIEREIEKLIEKIITINNYLREKFGKIFSFIAKMKKKHQTIMKLKAKWSKLQ